MEFWQTIRGYEDYDVSTLGRVRSWKRNYSTTTGAKILDQNTDVKGYKRVHLTDFNGTHKMIPVHRLVCEAFIRAFKEGEVTDHADRDPSNNKLSNLRICTQTQNMFNIETPTKVSNLPKGVYRSSEGRYRARIRVGDKLLHLGTYGSIEEAALAYNKKHEEVAKQYACLNDVDTELTYDDLHHVPHKKSNLPKGVRKIRDRYFARIKHQRKEISLGGYASIEEASEAYQKKCKELCNN